MNILILGSGGREHAIATQIAKSPKCSQLFVAPGNGGTSKIAKNVDLSNSDFEAIKGFVIENTIEMLVVGPEQPLVDGVVNYLKEDPKTSSLTIIGPSKAGAELEGSKEFAKKFMKKHGIPTADYQSFTLSEIEQGKTFLETLNPPYVLKADGLAAGKGVLILNDLNEAKEELENMLKNEKFGAASQTVVIEEFLDGIELSVFALTDGKSYKILPTAKDYKRIGEGDTGLNTGGMGAVSPVPFATPEFMQKVEDRIIKPTIDGIQKDNMDYKGFVFFGLIKVKDEPYVIEYNVRMGDPETEAVFPRIKNDIVDVFDKLGNNRLDEVTIDIDDRQAATIILVSGGYPEAYDKNKVISGLADNTESIVFHAGTKLENGAILTNGGRVLAITALKSTFTEALEVAYKRAENIDFDKKYYRKDIGFDL